MTRAAPSRVTRIAPLGGLLILASSAGVGAAALTPQEYAFGMAIMPAEISPGYRVTVPLEVYRTSVRNNLGDLRIFDAKGLSVPHRLAGGGAAAPPAPPVDLVIMPADPHGAGAAEPVTLVVENALDAGTGALLLHWPQSAADFAGRIRVEASDDLTTWRTLVTSAPIANLHAAGETLIENRIELGNLRSHYWRLGWNGTQAPFAIDGVQAQPAAVSSRSSWSTLFVNGTAVATSNEKQAGVDFDLGAALPVERVNLTLPEAGRVYAVEIQARAESANDWRSVAHAGFYRLHEERNAPVAVPLTQARYWRVRFAAGTPAPRPLRLEAGFSPHEIQFVANGTPPYLLAYGSVSAPVAPGDAAIPDGTALSMAGLGPRTNLGGADRISSGLATIAALGWRNSLIWVVVTLAFGIFTSRAVRMARRSGRLRR